MPADKGTAARNSGMTVDPALVRELADMLGETGLTEIEVEEGNKRIRVARNIAAAPAAAPMMAAHGPGPTLAPAAAPAAPAPSTADAPGNSVTQPHTGNAIKSPMVGTVYLAPEPGAANFFAVGDAVKKGDTLLIVEAMKVMNPITAPADGKVEQFLVDNGAPVEFDQPLVIIA